MKRPIVLIGPMGVGKTTIGKKLAKRLGLPFHDTDAEIVRAHGPISKLFDSRGEDAFRKLETESLIQCMDLGGVIATGGGVVTRNENHAILKSGKVIYLSTDGRHMAARLLTGKRPLIKNGVSDWRKIYEERKPTYSKLADYEVFTSGKPLTRIVSEIEEAVQDER